MIDENSSMIHTSLPSKLGTEKQAMALVEPFLERVGLQKDRLQDIQTLISEACLNAIEHGNSMDNGKSYDLELGYKEGTLHIRVFDQGGASAWKGLPSFETIDSAVASDQEPRGWGLQIIDHLADTWEFHVEHERTYLEMQVRMNHIGRDMGPEGEAVHETGT